MKARYSGASMWKKAAFGPIASLAHLLPRHAPPNALKVMIIACPACRTRYVVPDTAIGIDGRTVRCAKCKHSWFQDGPEVEAKAPPPPPPVEEHEVEAPPPPAPEPEPEPESETPVVEAETAEQPEPEGPPPQPSVSHWGSTEAEEPGAASEEQVSDEPVEEEAEQEPAAEEAAAEPVTEVEPEPEPEPSVVEVESEPSYYDEPDDGYSQFGYEPPFRGRRNPLKLWTAAAVVFFLAAVGAGFAVNYYGLPSWLPFDRPVFGMQQEALQLDFPPENQDLRTLPNGTEYFEAAGTVTNTGRETTTIPSILIVLRDEQDRIVYTWEVVPTQDQLAPGESLAIREAMVDVPRSARFVEIGWKPN